MLDYGYNKRVPPIGQISLNDGSVTPKNGVSKAAEASSMEKPNITPTTPPIPCSSTQVLMLGCAVIDGM